MIWSTRSSEYSSFDAALDRLSLARIFVLTARRPSLVLGSSGSGENCDLEEDAGAGDLSSPPTAIYPSSTTEGERSKLKRKGEFWPWRPGLADLVTDPRPNPLVAPVKIFRQTLFSLYWGSTGRGSGDESESR